MYLSASLFFFFFSVPVPLFWKVLNWPVDSIINPLEWPFVPVCMPCIDQVHRSQRSWQAECLLLYLFYLDIDVCRSNNLPITLVIVVFMDNGLGSAIY